MNKSIMIGACFSAVLLGLYLSKKRSQKTLSADELTKQIFPRYQEDQNSKDLESKAHFLDMSSWIKQRNSKERFTSIEVQELQGGVEGLILENVLSREECLNIINEIEKLSFGKLGKGRTGQAYRGNRRLQIEDENGKFSIELFNRIQPFISNIVNNEITGEIDDASKWKFECLNPRFRFAKYSSGEGFAVHKDKPTIYEHDRCSFVTINIYLNDLRSDQGGKTRFFEKLQSQQSIGSAGGVAGSLVLFKQSQFPNSPAHDGELLKYGIKYLMRTDLVYTRVI